LNSVLLSNILTEARSGFWGHEAGTVEVDALVIRNGDVQEDGLRWDALPLRGITQSEFDRARVRAGDIVLTTSGDCGFSAFITDEPKTPTIASNFVRLLRFDERRVFPRYAFHFIHSGAFRRRLEPFIRGTTLKNLSLTNAMEAVDLPIPFPDDPRRSLAEQKRIAAILDKADAIRRRRQEVLTEFAELPRSAFLDLLGDPALNPMGWPVVPLAESFSQDRPGAKCGPFGTALSKAEYTSSGVPVYGIDNVMPNRFREEGSLFITPDKFNDLRAYSVEDGDVLISRAGTVGRMCVARPKPREAIIGTNLIRVALNPAKMMPEYMSAVFTYFAGRLPGLRSSSDEDAYSFMKTGVLERLSLPTPDIGQQRKYADFVRSMEVRLSDAEMRRKAADTLFDSLVQRAFRGEL
jgi:type I restriction enzyme S subunit